MGPRILWGKMKKCSDGVSVKLVSTNSDCSEAISLIIMVDNLASLQCFRQAEEWHGAEGPARY